MTSEPDLGTTFGFSIVLKIEQEYFRKQDAQMNSRKSTPTYKILCPELSRRKCRVLIVEDNSINQKVASRQLEKFGLKTDVVANGEEALEALALVDYNLVLMDCQMPVMDGFETTRRIRSGEAGVKNRDIAIIALTAHAQEENRQQVFEAGMDEYLTKPINAQLLREALKTWIKKTAS